MADVLGALERARTMELEVRSQIEHIEQLHRIIKRASQSPEFAKRTLDKLTRLEREANDTIDVMCDAKREAIEYISWLSGEERSVLEGYFILGKSWQKLANDLYMSERRIFLLRKSGLDKLIDRFGDRQAM